MPWTDEDRRFLAEAIKADDQLRADHAWDECKRAKAMAETLASAPVRKSADGDVILHRRQENGLLRRRAKPGEGVSADDDGDTGDRDSPGSGVNVDEPAVLDVPDQPEPSDTYELPPAESPDEPPPSPMSPPAADDDDAALIEALQELINRLRARRKPSSSSETKALGGPTHFTDQQIAAIGCVVSQERQRGRQELAAAIKPLKQELTRVKIALRKGAGEDIGEVIDLPALPLRKRDVA